MQLLPSSPRMRRRLARLGAVGLAALAVVAVIALIPEKHSRPVQPASGTPPPQSVAAERTVPLTRADRRTINAMLDRFVPSAVSRHQVAASYDLATPNLREGATRSQWAKGDIPVYPYPAQAGRFHNWTVVYSYPRDASIDLMLHPRRGAKVGPITFSVGLKKRHGNWRIDSFVPAAVFSAPGKKAVVLAAKDFTPNPENSIPKRHLGHLWIALPIGVFSLLLVLPLTLFLVNWRRDRRAMRKYREELQREGRDRLPSLSTLRR